MGTSEPEPGTQDDSPHAPGPRASITGIPGWALIVVPFVLVLVVVGIGFAIAGATSIDGGPGFATLTPRAPSE